MDLKLLFNVSKVRLKTPKLGGQGKCVWFVYLELYISWSSNPRKIFQVETPPGMIIQKRKFNISK